MQSLSLVKNSIKEPKYTFVMAQLQPIPAFLFLFLRKVSQQSFFLLTDLCTISTGFMKNDELKRSLLFYSTRSLFRQAINKSASLIMATYV